MGMIHQSVTIAFQKQKQGPNMIMARPRKSTYSNLIGRKWAENDVKIEEKTARATLCTGKS
jgi:hypothetical protein